MVLDTRDDDDDDADEDDGNVLSCSSPTGRLRAALRSRCVGTTMPGPPPPLPLLTRSIVIVVVGPFTMSPPSPVHAVHTMLLLFHDLCLLPLSPCSV